MSYATRDDVLARAGRLQGAWTATSQPSLGDIDGFLDDSQGEIDAYIGAAGYATPTDDPRAVAALKGVTADKALLLALRATWPGGSGPTGVADLIADVEKRVAAYDSELAAGNLAALLLLASSSAATVEGGAASFWTTDGAQYEFWETLTAAWPRLWTVDPWGVPSSQQPAFRRNERF